MRRLKKCQKFQLTAARRRLGRARIGIGDAARFNSQPPEGGWWGVWLARAEALIVSTHSRPKAAGFKKRRPKPPTESFNSQPPEGGWVRLPHGKKPPSRFNSQPPEGGWMLPATRQMVLQRFNSQPPEGGWITC